MNVWFIYTHTLLNFGSEVKYVLVREGRAARVCWLWEECIPYSDTRSWPFNHLIKVSFQTPDGSYSTLKNYVIFNCS